MKSISVGLSSHLAQDVTTIARCLRITLSNSTVYAFTDHDQEVIVDRVTYSPVVAGTPTDIATTAQLNVDTVDASGVNDVAGITEDDLRAGLWDHAAFELFAVNYSDLAQGKMILRTGRLGEVTMTRGEFRAELRGMTQAYSRTIGEVVSASCRAVLGDSRCRVAMGPYTVTGSITGLNADGVTLYDTARTEAGPTGGFDLALSASNPVHATMTLGVGGEHLDLPNGSPIVISGATGDYFACNGVTTLTNYARGATNDTFDIMVNGSEFATGQGSPIVTPLGSDSGYFDYGLMTMTSGENDGLSMEVKSYIVGQITLQLPFPYALAVGDTYTLTAGCDRSMATCKDRFNNLINFVGEPYVPGLDKLIQVGRS